MENIQESVRKYHRIAEGNGGNIRDFKKLHPYFVQAMERLSVAERRLRSSPYTYRSAKKNIRYVPDKKQISYLVPTGIKHGGGFGGNIVWEKGKVKLFYAKGAKDDPFAIRSKGWIHYGAAIQGCDR